MIFKRIRLWALITAFVFLVACTGTPVETGVEPVPVGDSYAFPQNYESAELDISKTIDAQSLEAGDPVYSETGFVMRWYLYREGQKMNEGKCPGHFCERCWNYESDAVLQEDGTYLCKRCNEVVK